MFRRRADLSNFPAILYYTSECPSPKTNKQTISPQLASSKGHTQSINVSRQPTTRSDLGTRLAVSEIPQHFVHHSHSPSSESQAGLPPVVVVITSIVYIVYGGGPQLKCPTDTPTYSTHPTHLVTVITIEKDKV